MIKRVNLTIANIYFVRDRRTVIVDTGAPGSTARILTALDRHGIERRAISLILLTHAHGDHAGSARALRESLQVPVAVHRGDVAMLERGDNGTVVPVDLEAAIAQPFVDRPFPALTPDVLIDAESDLAEYGIEARLLHTPGHTPGSVTLLAPDGEAIIGDVLRGGLMGGLIFPARPQYPFFLNDLADKPVLHSSVRRMLDAGMQRAYTGHGGPIARASIERWLAAHHASGGA